MRRHPRSDARPAAIRYRLPRLAIIDWDLCNVCIARWLLRKPLAPSWIRVMRLVARTRDPIVPMSPRGFKTCYRGRWCKKYPIQRRALRAALAVR